MTTYYRPLVRFDGYRPPDALPLAGGPGWFTHAVKLRRDAEPEQVHAADLPEIWQVRLSVPRPPIAGMVFDRPRIMGILNVTPDSFSDGGRFNKAATALNQARTLAAAGADILDIGGESTRPGAETVPTEAEIARVEPVIRAIASELAVPMSIDTRKSAVADAAVTAGARLVNDVSGFTFDPMLARFCVNRGRPVCVMHTQGTPEVMQEAPDYDNVLLDVYDFLETQVQMLEAAGLPRGRIIVDPGIGFGKLIPHNLAILRDVALFHGLGCAVLIGASRKGFIGKISGTGEASQRAFGSVACALAAAAQGVQVLRVHDVAETAQALALWTAISLGDF